MNQESSIEMQKQESRIKNREKIRNFTDLRAWQKGHELVLYVYQLTRKFPKDELFALTSQLRRAVISITSNIAEGFSRHSYKEKVNFYHISLGSTTEVENQPIISKDIGYISETEFQKGRVFVSFFLFCCPNF
ncbi:MAG: four helix bundle protein [Candidatus Zambryskibacteria bacterium]|nr:four helix bundle protein [Candidatus Zambryskibacteria bacterium]